MLDSRTLDASWREGIIRFHVDQTPSDELVFQLLSDVDEALLTSSWHPTREAMLDALGRTLRALEDHDFFDVHLVDDLSVLVLEDDAGSELARSRPFKTPAEALKLRDRIVGRANTQDDFEVTLTTTASETRALRERAVQEDRIARYDFSRRSDTRRVGFETFKTEEDSWVFHFNGPDGVPILYSRAMRNRSELMRRMRSVATNARSVVRFHRLDDGWAFALRSRNGNEIARSRPFAAAEEAEEALQYVHVQAPRWLEEEGATQPTQERTRRIVDYDLTLRSDVVDSGPQLMALEDGSHTFLFNDEDGEPLLFGSAYAGRTSRDNGVRSVIRNAADMDRMGVERDFKGLYFTVRAGNHRVVARSRHFRTHAAMEAMMSWLFVRVRTWASIWDVEITATHTEYLTLTRADQFDAPEPGLTHTGDIEMTMRSGPPADDEETLVSLPDEHESTLVQVPEPPRTPQLQDNMPFQPGPVRQARPEYTDPVMPSWATPERTDPAPTSFRVHERTDPAPSAFRPQRGGTEEVTEPFMGDVSDPLVAPSVSVRATAVSLPIPEDDSPALAPHSSDERHVARISLDGKAPPTLPEHVAPVRPPISMELAHESATQPRGGGSGVSMAGLGAVDPPTQPRARPPLPMSMPTALLEEPAPIDVAEVPGERARLDTLRRELVEPPAPPTRASPWVWVAAAALVGVLSASLVSNLGRDVSSQAASSQASASLTTLPPAAADPVPETVGVVEPTHASDAMAAAAAVPTQADGAAAVPTQAAAAAAVPVEVPEPVEEPEPDAVAVVSPTEREPDRDEAPPPPEPEVRPAPVAKPPPAATRVSPGGSATIRLPDGSAFPLAPDSTEAKVLGYLNGAERGFHVFRLDRLTYGSDSHTINDVGAEQIWLLGEMLRAHPEVTVFVRGLRDSGESAVYSGPDPSGGKSLSALRAGCIVQRWAEQGVDYERLSMEGAGATRVISRTEPASNRRVEIVLAR